MKKIVFPTFAVLIPLLFCALSGVAQNGNPNPNPSLTNVVPPSPNAAALGKFGDVPVGYATGIPQIGVPIYSYQNADKSLNLSVSLDYHAGGIKVDELSSNVGIGWALNAGGVITRTVRGIADEITSVGFMNSPVLPVSESEGNRYSSSIYMRINANYHDGQTDIFNFNFGGHSGKFMFGKNGDFLMLTPNKLKIEKQLFDGSITKFTVTDELGVKYIFDAVETIISRPPPYNAFFSSWYLTKIIAPFATEEITLEYENEYYSYATGLVASETTCIDPYMGTPQESSSSLQASEIFGKRVKKINFPNNTDVRFLYDNVARTDLGSYYAGASYRLKQISVNSAGSSRGFNLYHDYSLGRLTLLKVSPYDATSENNGYSFFYDTPPPARISIQQDHWGFYNSNTGSLFPEETCEGRLLPGGSRETDVNRVKCGSLIKMAYPTGGYTEFEMEANKIYDTRLATPYAGGIRIKSIKDYDGISFVPTTAREYEYLRDDNVTSSGALGNYPQYSFGVYYDFRQPCHPPMGVNDYRDYFNNGGIANFIVRSSSSVQTLALINGSPVNYSRVIEKFINNGQNNGKIIRYYNSFYDSPVTGYVGYPFTPPFFEDWGYGQLTKEEVYDATNSKIKQTINEYQVTQDFYYNTPGRLDNFRSVSIAPVKYEWQHPQGCTYGIEWFDWSKVTKPDYFVSTFFAPGAAGRLDLSKTTVTEYANGQQLVSETNYTYDENYNLKKTVTTNSRNEQIEQVNYYPYNYTASTLATSMINDHNLYGLSVSTEVWKTIGTTKYLAGGMVNQYQQQASGIRKTAIEAFQSTALIPPSNVPAFNTAFFNRAPSLFKEKVVFNAYNAKGQVVEQQKSNDVKQSYLWGYNGAYPVAEIVGKSYNDAVSQSSIDLSVINNSQTGDAAMRLELNKLRSLSNCLVTTYTYKPLIGMTSATDPNGRTTYYEYDGFGRLSLVRDKDNNVLKKICYNYAGQPENCLAYSNAAINTYYSSQSCPPGQSPLPYHVSVAAGQFTASTQAGADAQAQQYAQSQANQNGSCQSSDVQLSYSNYSGDYYTVELQNTTGTGSTYYFTMYSGSGLLGTVPTGTYNVYIYPNYYTQYLNYSVGCGYYGSGYYGTSIYGVSISSSCNNISVY